MSADAPGAEGRTRPPPLVVATTLSLLLGLQPLTTDLYLPALPQIRTLFEAPMSAIQLTMSALILAFGLAQLVWGPVADRWGRRPVLLSSLAMYAAASAGCALAPTIEWLVALRAAQGAMLAAAVVVGRAMVRDLYEPHEGGQVMSRGMSGLGIIALVSPALGGALAAAWGWQSTLLTNAAAALVILGFITLKVPETLPARHGHPPRPRELLQRAGVILLHPGFRAWALLVTGTYAGLFVMLSTSSFVFIQTLGLSPLAYGIALGTSSLAYLTGTVFCRQWIATRGLVGAVALGARFTAAGAVALLLVGVLNGPWIWPVLGAQWLYSFGHGVHQPCGQTGAVAPFPQMAGLASALAGFILATTAFVIGLVLGWAFDGSVRFMSFGIALSGAITAATALTAVQRHGHSSPGFPVLNHSSPQRQP